MAENKPNSGFIKCDSYDLDMKVDKDGPVFTLHVVGDDDKKYNLVAEIIGDKKDLVQTALHKLASIWYDSVFEFRANDKNEIIEIR